MDKVNLSGYELGVFFSIFVMLQFWNLFNAKYFRTDRSLIQDIIDVFRRPEKVRQSYSQGFIWIVLVILLGQILIVSFAGSMFNVAPLDAYDWGWILLITSPVLVVSDIVRFVRNMIKKNIGMKSYK
jgi:Ca2+-transporting ATPase